MSYGVFRLIFIVCVIILACVSRKIWTRLEPSFKYPPNQIHPIRSIQSDPSNQIHPIRSIQSDPSNQIHPIRSTQSGGKLSKCLDVNMVCKDKNLCGDLHQRLRSCPPPDTPRTFLLNSCTTEAPMRTSERKISPSASCTRTGEQNAMVVRVCLCF